MNRKCGCLLTSPLLTSTIRIKKKWLRLTVTYEYRRFKEWFGTILFHKILIQNEKWQYVMLLIRIDFYNK